MSTKSNHMNKNQNKLTLGYACICLALSDVKPKRDRVFTNRTCIKKTFESKGLDYISSLVLLNVTDLIKIIQWNEDNGIKFYRMSSDIFPWCTTYKLRDLKDFEKIKEKCIIAGDLARKYNQRLTFHPNHFVCLGSPNDTVVENSIKELETHSDFLDLMRFEPSLWNKCNIHIGGVYGSKEETIKRFKKTFRSLSDNCKKRLTIENDDKANSYSVDDLVPIARELGVGVVFDIHHYKFCPGKLSAKEAFLLAKSTWGDVRPVVHWSESEPDGSRKLSAHSDYVQGPISLWGYEDSVDIMIEAKMKEKALLKYMSNN